MQFKRIDVWKRHNHLTHDAVATVGGGQSIGGATKLLYS
ncbi:hypothetical protein MA5S0921_0875 [Mycobacteroides abscessus 5S-0921]|nr:hypothetical protein MA5S0421_0399 [Mycobacteroides abscessus 5S-0421]EIU17792.1 hypothetical protein MA5S0304_0142 [Mycobacteroides abscessus 5S-0304]EIU44010.1 hypothetical protein MA5S1215_1926 [Mycobacteroides abscessus 5S-1215]EIU99046.1 hypothetical protein MA5S0921_0875 [Mycobacteroides abscessus 5S-0921]